jgi:exonuclease III
MNKQIAVSVLAVPIITGFLVAGQTFAHEPEASEAFRQKHERDSFLSTLTEEQREEFKTLHEEGNRGALKAFFEEHDLKRPKVKKQRHQFLSELTEEQRETLKTLHEAGDREAIDAFFQEQGIERPDRPHKGFQQQ